MSKLYSKHCELQEKILKGVTKLAENVGATMGPRGKNVIIKNKDGNPFITKDGVTVAASINFEDPFEDLGAQLVKQATLKTNSEAGDGTTTSTILTKALLQYGYAGIEQNRSVSEIKRGMQHAKDIAVSQLQGASIKMKTLKEIRHVASVSSNADPEITDIICEAVTAVGKGGSITVEEARSSKTDLELTEGFRFDSGLAARAFATDERLGLCRFENPLFLLTDEKLENVQQVLPALEVAARESRPLVIVADEVEGQALAALIMNSVRGSMKVVAVKAPRYGEERRQIMSDLSISVGAKYFSQFMGNPLTGTQVSLNDFGSAKTVVITRDQSTIIGGHGDPENIASEISEIENKIAKEESSSVLSLLMERKNRLSSGVATIRVGAPTEVEMIEKKHRIEDALEAVKSAQQEGYVPGGGLTLYMVAASLKIDDSKHPEVTDSFKYGFEVVRQSLHAPLGLLCQNAQVEKADVIEGLTSDLAAPALMGYDFNKDVHVDMIESGIIDPTKVTRCALENAVSVASTLLTTSVAIVEE